MKPDWTACVVLFSGGLDSTIALYLARERFDRVYALTINYGQANVDEINAARNIFALALMNTECKLEHVALRMEFLAQLADSGLTGGVGGLDSDDIHPIAAGYSNAFVPGRNLFFLSAAASLAYSKNAKTIYIGTTMRGYPDCRTEFLRSMARSIDWGLGNDLTDPNAPIRVISPYEECRTIFSEHIPRRDQWMELAIELPGCWEAISQTLSCYKGHKPACGECLTCQKRYWGFEQIGVVDPIEYAKMPEFFEWGVDE